MSTTYAVKYFFRKVPNNLLEQYFTRKKILTELNWRELSETKIEPIYIAYQQLDDTTRKQIERDFQVINSMATEGGSKSIIDEANYHGDTTIVSIFASLKGFYEHAFWTFLERPRYWEGATAFYHADTVPSSYWRKRKNLPCKVLEITPEAVNNFEKEIGMYYHVKQARGKNCKIDCYKRNNLDYFFAYPEDYARASIEWQHNQFERRPH